jgi:hypothetical protein
MKGLWGWGITVSRGSVEGPRGGLLYRGTRKMRFLRDMQMSCRWASIFIGALLGNLEGIRLPGRLREMNSMSEYRCEPRGHSGFKSV